MAASEGLLYIEKHELIFLGTGTSGGLPDLGCLLDQVERKCKTCWNATEPGSKNRRQNTSVVIKTTFTPITICEASPAVRTRNILIDCGKYFWASALRTFPLADVDHLDAVILTHAHADAFFGVDDLRDFSNLREGGKTLPVYVREQDVPEIRRAFPYLMNKGKTTNNMHVPALEFLIYDEHAPFNVCDVEITPLQVHHGPSVTASAFCFGNSIYMSDVNEIPETVREFIKTKFQIPSRPASSETPTDTSKPLLDMLILDALWPEKSYNSHFSLLDAIREFKAFRPIKGYTTGMSHDIEHYTFNEKMKQVSVENDLDLELAWDGLVVDIVLPRSAERWLQPAPKQDSTV